MNWTLLYELLVVGSLGIGGGFLVGWTWRKETHG